MDNNTKKKIVASNRKGDRLVISYLRFSRPEQLKGDSLRRQADLAKRWCAKHGLKLTDRLEDKGISAFRGGNSQHGALAEFLELVRVGTIPPGSILLVEELDRISRQEPEEALHLFLSIIRTGITLVTLNTDDMFEKGKIDTGKLMIAVVKFCTAHDESQKKSLRLAAAWEEKRARIGEVVLTRRLPAWLTVREGRVVVHDQKASVVRKMFQWVLDGEGLFTVCKRANAELEAIGRKNYYPRSYVSKILHNRAVIGEFQPHRHVWEHGRRRREPVGQPITGYYPAILDPQVFYAVQSKLAQNRRSGGPSSGWVSLFTGLLYDRGDGSRLQVQDKGGGRRYVSAAALDGREGASPYVGFPVTAFEGAFLVALGAATDLELGDSNMGELREKLLAVEGQLEAVAKRTSDIQAALFAGGTPAPSAVAVLTKLDTQRSDLQRRRQELQTQMHGAATRRPVDYVQKVGKVVSGSLTSTMTREQRWQVRKLIRQLVERVGCHTTRQGYVVTCDVTVTLWSGRVFEYALDVYVREPKVMCVRAWGKGHVFWADGNRVRKITDAQVSVFWSPQHWLDSVKREGVQAVAKRLGIHWSTVYRRIAEANRQPSGD